MPITIGTHLGSHEITALHGKGGMGEVYRARDTKLNREVGIKILPEEFSRDADRVGRLQREVDVLPSLNHPNIAGIYDLQEANSYPYLVLEYPYLVLEYPYLVLELVEGKTLADRIARGAIPVEDSLKIPKSICKTLQPAHEKGMMHRDLKPANVKIIRAGNVKVRDFGLTKALERNPLQILSNSPTLLSTVAGTFFARSVGRCDVFGPRHLLFTRNDSLMAQKVNPFYECAL